MIAIINSRLKHRKKRNKKEMCQLTKESVLADEKKKITIIDA